MDCYYKYRWDGDTFFVYNIGCSLLAGRKGILKESPKKLFTTILYSAGVAWYFLFMKEQKKIWSKLGRSNDQDIAGYRWNGQWGR